MIKDGHLDRDIIKFMIDKKLYMRFARRYLQRQIDEVDIEALRKLRETLLGLVFYFFALLLHQLISQILIFPIHS